MQELFNPLASIHPAVKGLMYLVCYKAEIIQCLRTYHLTLFLHSTAGWSAFHITTVLGLFHVQEFPWVIADQHQADNIPDATTIPLKSISSSILKVSCRLLFVCLFVCLFVSGNLARTYEITSCTLGYSLGREREGGGGRSWWDLVGKKNTTLQYAMEKA